MNMNYYRRKGQHILTSEGGASGQGDGVRPGSRKRNIFGRWGRACPLTAMTSSSVGHTFNFHYTLLRCLGVRRLAVSGCDPGVTGGSDDVESVATSGPYHGQAGALNRPSTAHWHDTSTQDSGHSHQFRSNPNRENIPS